MTIPVSRVELNFSCETVSISFSNLGAGPGSYALIKLYFVFRPVSLNGPPATISVALVLTLYTAAFNTGFHVWSTVVFELLTDARFVRPVPFTELNDPPKYTLFERSETLSTLDPTITGSQLRKVLLETR